MKPPLLERVCVAPARFRFCYGYNRLKGESRVTSLLVAVGNFLDWVKG